ncbi:RNase H domain-containing protein [Trichonephila clavipes]|nr:RNase H domain-containing protein [Trichonephila clavipes]
MNLNVLEEDKNYIIRVLQDLNIGGDQIISIPRLITFLDFPCKIYTNRFKFQDKNLPIPAINVLFDETVEREFQKFFIIATDASKNDQITSIAETLAICQALDDLVESNVNLLVLSDSLSVLSALQNFSIKSNKDYGPTHLTSTYSECTRWVFGGIEPRPSGLESDALTPKLPAAHMNVFSNSAQQLLCVRPKGTGKPKKPPIPRTHFMKSANKPDCFQGVSPRRNERSKSTSPLQHISTLKLRQGYLDSEGCDREPPKTSHMIKGGTIFPAFDHHFTSVPLKLVI